MIYYITYITYFIPIEIIDIIAIIDIISLPCRTPCRTVPWNPLAFITYRGTIPMPTSWQTTSCIRPRNPPGGRQAHLESDCVGSAELFRCHRQEPPAVFQGYFQWGWRRELDSCSRARIGPWNQQIPAILKCCNSYNKHNTHNWYKWFNWYNYHFQDRRTFPASIRVRIRRTWIQCQS